MRPLVLTIACLLAFLPPALKAQDTVRLSLQQSLQYASKNQIRVKNAIVDEQIALARNKEVSALALPKVSANGNISYAPLVAAFQVPNFIKQIIAGQGDQPGLVKDAALNQEVVNGMPDVMSLAFQPRWTTTGTLQANQVLFDPSVMVALQARRTIEELAAKGVQMTEQDVKVAVMKAYYNVLIAEKQRGLVDQNIGLLEQMHREMTEMNKAGFTEKIDVDRLSVALNNLRTQKIRVDQVIGLAYLSLKFQMGMPLRTPIALTDSLSENSIEEGILAQNLDFANRIEYQLLETQARLNAFDVRRYKLAWLPTLSLFGNYGYTLYNQEKLFQKGDQWQRSAMFGTTLNVPIFDGFQRRAKLRQAELTLERSHNDLENLRNSLTLENASARITLRNNLLALQNQRQNMELARAVYTTASIKYREGVGSSLEVMNAETALREAQTNYFTALYDVTTSRIDLQRSLGMLR